MNGLASRRSTFLDSENAAGLEGLVDREIHFLQKPPELWCRRSGSSLMRLPYDEDELLPLTGELTRGESSS